jgi:hypothetical protein
VINRIRLAAASALALAALPALAQKPQIQWNDEYNFDQVETFQWQSIDEAQMSAANPFMHSLIKNLLAAELAQSGLTEVTSNPDVYVTYYGSTETEVQLRTDSYGYSYGGYGMGGWGYYGYGAAGPVSSTTRQVEIQHGTLVVDIWDRETEELVWRGTVTDVMPSSGDQAKIEKLVAKAISKLCDEGRELWEKEVERRADAAEDAAREAARGN